MIKNKIKNIYTIVIFYFLPFIVLADIEAPTGLEDDKIDSLKELIERIVSIIELIIPILGSLALVMFIWGLADFILYGSNEQKKTKGKMLMTWGVIGLFVMVSVWGLVGLFHDTFF